MIIKLANFLSQDACNKHIQYFDSIKDKKQFTDVDIENHEECNKELYLELKESLKKYEFLAGSLDLSTIFRFSSFSCKLTFLQI